MKYTQSRRARIALMASAAPAFGALIALNPFTASADTGESDETSTGPSSGISISSGPVSGSSGTIVVDDKPVGSLITPGVDTSTDPGWVPVIGGVGPRTSQPDLSPPTSTTTAPARTPHDIAFGTYE